MTIFDISLKISTDMTIWPGNEAVALTRSRSMDKGDHLNMTSLALSVHTGTHVDAPDHFLNNGQGIDSLPLDILTGPCYVTQLPDDVDEISADVLERIPIGEGTIRLLFGTRNSRWWARQDYQFHNDYVAVTADGAEWLVEHGIKLVGVDYLSVAPMEDSTAPHVTLLKAGVIIVEGLNLAEIPRGFYNLYCLPLNIQGADGAPARAILIN